MSKRTVYTTLTPLPPGISRETVMETLHSPFEMIDLNPLVEERHPIKPPSNATPEEFHCLWYSITDRVQYLPGNIASGKVTYHACFHDLEWGVQTHCYAPMGLDIKGKWTLGGSLPGEPIAPVELGLGAPLHGLYLREDVDMRCNVLMTSFVKKTTKRAHMALIGRLVVKAQLVDAVLSNRRIGESKLNTSQASNFSGSQASIEYSPSEYPETPAGNEAPQLPPLQGLIFQGQENDRSSYNDRSLYPEALRPVSSRNSGASYNGSISNPGSYPNQRVSYQNLNPRNTAPMPQQQSPSPSPSMQQLLNRSRNNSIQQQQHIKPHFQAPSSSHNSLPSQQMSRNPAPYPNSRHNSGQQQQMDQQYPYPNPNAVYNQQPQRGATPSYHHEFDGGYDRRLGQQGQQQYKSRSPQFGHVELQG